MVVIPEYFMRSIHRYFGKNGDHWLKGIQSIVDTCTQRFGLSSPSVADGLSVNLVCFADSAEFGPVMLKVCYPAKEFFSEIESLLLFEGKGICRCFAYDYDLGAMVLERLLPGEDLNSISNRDERVRVASRIIADLPIPAPAVSNLPRFDDWIARAFDKARKGGNATADFLEHIDTAEALYASLTEAGGTEYLLHGDLHHTNMLSSDHDANQHYLAIDPKGVIGMREMETGRFIQNHLALYPLADGTTVLKKTAGMISAGTGYPVKTVLTAAYIDYILSSCWTLEEHLPEEAIAAAQAKIEQSANMYRKVLSLYGQ